MKRELKPINPSILGSAKVLVSELITNFSERESWNLAKILVEHITSDAWFRFRTDPERRFSDLEWNLWQELSGRIRRLEPIQYVIGIAWFRELELEVGPGVLIPRPETEELVSWVLDSAKDQPGLEVLDIGTGSGCIAISLAVELLTPKVTAIDLSADALYFAKRNAAKSQALIHFIEADAAELSKLNLPPMDVIVCNPPYVLESDRAEMNTNVLKYEPELALFVPDQTPLLHYISVSESSRNLLVPGGRLFFEIHELYGQAVSIMMEERGFVNIQSRMDLSGKTRMVCGTNPS
ncbi:MAG TPA: peptide chain release factor N(5)-glutamine methyltransferase [Bacteroidetes bacterium]|nr:peptide chain release factor N(5)-glutamine methyltransferase [Bacteroidota bacterium]